MRTLGLVLLVACGTNAPTRSPVTAPQPQPPQPQQVPSPSQARPSDDTGTFDPNDPFDERYLRCHDPLTLNFARAAEPVGTDIPVRTILAPTSCRRLGPDDSGEGPHDVDLSALSVSVRTKRDFERVLHCSPPAKINFAHDRVRAISLGATVTRVVVSGDEKSRSASVVVRFTGESGQRRILLVLLPRDTEEGSLVSCP